LTKAKTEFADQSYEVKRLANDKVKLNKEIEKLNVQSLKSQGEGSASGATIARL